MAQGHLQISRGIAWTRFHIVRIHEWIVPLRRRSGAAPLPGRGEIVLNDARTVNTIVSISHHLPDDVTVAPDPTEDSKITSPRSYAVCLPP